MLVFRTRNEIRSFFRFQNISPQKFHPPRSMGKSGWPLQEEDNKDPYFFRYSLKAALTCLTIEHSNFQYKHAGL